MSSGWVRCSVFVAVWPAGTKLCFSVSPKTSCLAVSVLGALVLALAAGAVELELEHPAVPSPAATTAAPSQAAVRRLKMVTDSFVCHPSDARRSGVNHEAERYMAGKGPTPKGLVNVTFR